MPGLMEYENNDPLTVDTGTEKRLFPINDDVLFSTVNDEDTLLRLDYSITMNQELCLENTGSRAVDIYIRAQYMCDIDADYEDSGEEEGDSEEENGISKDGKGSYNDGKDVNAIAGNDKAKSYDEEDYTRNYMLEMGNSRN